MIAHYDPSSIQCIGCTTLYEEFHEHAHLEQHARKTIPWRIREVFTNNSWLRYTGAGMFFCCLMEVEAFWIARRELKALSLWDCSTRNEAVSALLTYLKKLFFEA